MVPSFFLAGFECSTHRRADGARLDLVRSTGHEAAVLADYRACAELGLSGVRDGLRWHLIETAPGVYDWSSWLPMLEAAAKAGVEVVWDLFHYGAPDHLDQGGEPLPDALARFAAEAARVHRAATGKPLLATPVNEISFFAWAVSTGYFPPAGPEAPGGFKRQLVRAGLKAVAAIREADPGCRIAWAEPLIHVAPAPGGDAAAAAAAREAQFEAMDLILGLEEPELGGSADAADLIGVNFYPENQWQHGGGAIPLGHPDYRPLAALLEEAWRRYGKPLYIAETGAHGSARPAWLHYVCDEVREAQARGVPVEGICLYPVTFYPRWHDDHACAVGLFGSVDAAGRRPVDAALAAELARQQGLFACR